ncbi:MFS transporter [Streptomyces sp. ME19-01-6]|uniref:MFS transporter n=1 Tax=Streptomyces sp. ME19-01-6 TaxID=3028686 RepID=UPI0029A916F4|nr:MFS transporter [Streptomyces sp. ME19-01-6]MDX3226508.1 MFS transporter [Streptomyces sp. ME19-01-6]
MDTSAADTRAAAETDDPPGPGIPPKAHRVIIAASVGNALEWFDIAIYGFFAATIAKLFFPSSDDTVSLLLAFGTFGVSYVVRPLGAVVLGRYADRVGRKAALMVSIKLMMLGTLLIAAMPTYDVIGAAAPAAILLARLIQGFSAGGEFGSSTAFLVEHAPRLRGFMSSWQFASQGVSTLLAATFGTVLTGSLSTAQMESWGWRVPFLFGLLIGPVGYYIRRHVDEAPAFVRSADAEPERGPVAEVLRHHKGRVLLAIGVLAVSTAITYLITYMPVYAVKELDLPASTGFAATMVTGAVLTVVTPLIGLWSDRAGRIRIMAAFAALILALLYPTFAFLVAHPGFGVILAVMFLVGVLKAGYFGALPALLSDLFPVSSRATGMSLSYNLGVMLFGGTTPVVIVWLVDATGNSLAMTWYLSALALLSLACVLLARRRYAVR